LISNAERKGIRVLGWAAKENREGGRLGRFRKEIKIQPKTIGRKNPF
jgi:hypothetical protein